MGVEVKCDCPVFRRTPNICQHALATAEDLNCLPQYLLWVRKTKRSANLSQLIANAVPKTGGQKSSSRREGGPKQKASESCSVSKYAPSLASFDPSVSSQTFSNSPHAFRQYSHCGSPSMCSPSYQVHSPMYSNSIDMHSSFNFGMRHQPETTPNDSEDDPKLFTLQWLTGSRIRMCYGCSSPIRTDTSSIPLPPYDLVIRYKERRFYCDPKSQTEKLTKNKENTYYHSLKQCVTRKHPTFVSWMLYAPEDVLETLTPTHKYHLYNINFLVCTSLEIAPFLIFDMHVLSPLHCS